MTFESPFRNIDAIMESPDVTTLYQRPATFETKSILVQGSQICQRDDMTQHLIDPNNKIKSNIHMESMRVSTEYRRNVFKYVD